MPDPTYSYDLLGRPLYYTKANSGATGNKTNTISGFTATEARNGYLYRCVITDSSGNTVTSDIAKLHTTSLAIYKDAEDFWGVLGDSVSFTVQAYGEGLTYLWQYSYDGGETWDTSGAAGNKTNRLYGVTITNTRLGFLYRCVITDENGNSVISSPVRMRLKTDTWNYTYDADGMRTKRTDGNTTYQYTYNGSQLAQMTVGSNTLRFTYDAAGTPLRVTYNGTTYYYVTNLQGDVVAIVNASGAKQVEYSYTSWGKLISTTGTLASTLGAHNPLRYRGYVYDTETELYYLQSRYYDPDVGRFINGDSLTTTGQGILGNSMFAYCLNSPVVLGDSDGRDAILLLDINFPTHIGILVQDEDGVWWHFYWGADFEYSSGSFGALIPCGLPATTWCEEYKGEVTLSGINNSKQYYNEYEDMCYLTGDFSSCVEEMRNPVGNYNLYSNNCSQYSLRILSSADTPYKKLLEKNATVFYPMTAFNNIKPVVNMYKTLTTFFERIFAR